jgi:hydroxyacylglutathione hydrolase
MYDSLTRLAALPGDDTLVYCAHEYTEANLRFALGQATCSFDAGAGESDQPVPALRRSGAGQLRPADAASRQATSPLEVFTVLREWKNGF